MEKLGSSTEALILPRPTLSSAWSSLRPEKAFSLDLFLLSPNPPKGVVEMAEQGIRGPEERLSR